MAPCTHNGVNRRFCPVGKKRPNFQEFFAGLVMGRLPGPGRDDLRVVTGRAGAGRDFYKGDGLGRARRDFQKIDGPGRTVKH